MTLSNQAILDYIAAHPGARREDIRRQAAPDASETTVWRALKRLLDEGKLEVSGKGPATGYSLAGPAVVRALGPYLAGYLYDLTGTYLLAMGVSMLSIVLVIYGIWMAASRRPGVH